MKAISLWQPWASAIAVGAKSIETRHWSTHHRGPIAIHAAKRRVPQELIHIHSHWNWQGAMRPLRWSFGNRFNDDMNALGFGVLVAVCDLVDCRPTDSFTQAELDSRRRPNGETSDSYDWTERQMGDFALGRFGWVLENIRRLSQPIHFVGKQGLFNVPDALLSDALKEAA